jgi:hypothetical protein
VQKVKEDGSEREAIGSILFSLVRLREHKRSVVDPSEGEKEERVGLVSAKARTKRRKGDCRRSKDSKAQLLAC